MSRTTTKSLAGFASVAASIGTDFAGILSGSLNGLLLAAAMFLFVRRNALAEPLDGWPLVAAGAVAAWMAMVVRLLEQTRETPRPQISVIVQRALFCLPTISLLTLGLALSIPGTATASLFVFWSLIGLEEVWAGATAIPGAGRWIARPGRRFPAGLFRTMPLVEPTPRAVAPMLAEEALDAQVESSELGEYLDGDVSQRLIRSQSLEGDDVFRGRLRTAVAAEQRTCHVHVAFCPPFAELPQLEFQQTAGPPARIKPGQLLPYGLRFDLKLSAPGPAVVDIEFTATCPMEVRSTKSDPPRRTK